MNVINCKGCGRLFNAITRRKLCPTCMSKLEDKFQEVKKYIGENAGANIDVVSRECDVSVKQIKDWVKEERLTFSETSMSGVECEQCGRMIRTGKYCEDCKNKIATNLRSALDGKKPPHMPKRTGERDKDRMRFL